MTFFGAVTTNFNTKDPYAQEDYMDVSVTKDWDTENAGSFANVWDDIKASTDFRDLVCEDLGGGAYWARGYLFILLELEGDGTIKDAASIRFRFSPSGLDSASYEPDPDSTESCKWLTVPPVGATVKVMAVRTYKWYFSGGGGW